MFKISAPNATVLIELSTHGTAKTFAFPPNEERALTVGSDERAELRVTGVGVAPVQFHLERRDGIVRLIPAYGLGDLRVNTARVSGPIQLEERNVIEFGDVRIDAIILDAGQREPTSSDDVWSHQPARISEPPGEGDATHVAMRAVTSTPNGIGQQTTAMLSPIDARDIGPQQTERMAPYRPDAAPPTGTPPMPVQNTERMAPVQRATSHPSVGPVFTALGTEIMAPFRPDTSEDPDSPPPTVRAKRRAHVTVAPVARSTLKTRDFGPAELKQTALQSLVSSFDGNAAPTQVAAPPIVPLPIVAVTIVAPAKMAPAKTDASFPCAEVADSNTTLFELPAVRPEQRFADSRSREVTPTAVDMRSPVSQGSSRDETPNGVAKARPPASRTLVWLAKLGLLAKARPVLVACGATAGALVLAATLLAATRLIQHHEARRSQSVKPVAARPVTPDHTFVAAPSAQLTLVQIVEAQATEPAGSATRTAASLLPRKTPNDPELAAAVADVIAGRYSDARVAYAALSQRAGNARTYASLSRLLGRAESPECVASGQGAPKDCPGVHR
jgi:hypothetical protein